MTYWVQLSSQVSGEVKPAIRAFFHNPDLLKCVITLSRNFSHFFHLLGNWQGQETAKNKPLYDSMLIDSMRPIQSILRLFFRLLYHQFAWTYDLVAALVSLGRWQAWVRSVLPYLDGRILEIGFGPGHLQLALHGRGLPAFGLDESLPMCRQAIRRLRRKGYSSSLSRGLARAIPFQNSSFDCVVSTFPAEYIFEPQTLRQIHRVLVPGGRLVILPAAWITGTGLPDRLAAGLFELTGQAGALAAFLPGMESHIRSAGFAVRHELLEFPGSRVLVLTAKK